MFKLIRRLIGIAIVLFLAAVIFLVPSSVNPKEQLKNVEGSGASWTSIIEPTLSNANVTTQGISTEISLNNSQINQLLKMSLADSQNKELLDSVYSISGDRLRVQYPLKLAFVNSKVDLELGVVIINNVLHFDIRSAKLGSFPVPKSLVTAILKQQLASNNSSISTEGDSFLFSLPQSQFSIDKINLQDSHVKIQFSMGLI